MKITIDINDFDALVDNLAASVLRAYDRSENSPKSKVMKDIYRQKAKLLEKMRDERIKQTGK
ncbi:hypothetical protein [Hydrogenimonas urashimensis]|uniref:hypothetical protein n=1 Tax=Hydrogenimonas urashimensis TaxID=2740515 RepID=UPI00191534ED|nr:hypothetical protein [Hydrogenimonas urashimensis]